MGIVYFSYGVVCYIIIVCSRQGGSCSGTHQFINLNVLFIFLSQDLLSFTKRSGANVRDEHGLKECCNVAQLKDIRYATQYFGMCIMLDGELECYCK
jgi:hypothetical protein